MKRELKGYITVYLSLLLGVLLTLVFVILEGVRQQTIRTEVESVMDISLFSVFGEYNRELLKQYEIFGVDTTYGQGQANLRNTEEHLQYYMNENFHKDGLTGLLNYRDLTALNCDNVTIREYCLLSDDKGQVLKEQIVDYMQRKKGLGIVENIFREYEIMVKDSNTARDVEGEWEETDKIIAGKLEQRREQWTGEGEIPLLDNPADHVKTIRQEGVLGLVLPPDKTISAAAIHPEYYFSHRKPRVGTGRISSGQNLLDEVTGRVFLHEYLFEKCGNFLREKEDSLLKYQIEYLICKQGSDGENLEETVNKILIMREGINFAYLLSDAGKMQEADNLALLVSTACLMPEIKDAVKMAILFAWSYAESIQDIRILLDGNKIPAVKNEASWNVPLSRLLDFTSYLGEYKSSEEGMCYEDFLGLFLYMEKEQQILFSFMDICEMDIRMTKGNEYFEIDGCITQLKAASSISSGYTGGYSITRSWYY